MTLSLLHGLSSILPEITARHYERLHQRELNDFSKHYVQLYTARDPTNGIEKLPLTTENGTLTPPAPSSPLIKPSCIRNAKSLYQLKRSASTPDDRRWQSAPCLEGGNVASEKAEKRTPSAGDYSILQKAIQEGDSNTELLGKFVVQMRTDSRRGLFKPTRIGKPTSVKAFLGLQQLIVYRYQKELERLCQKIFGQERLNIDELDQVHRTMHNYCAAVDDLEKMRARAPTGASRPRGPASGSKESLLRSLIEEAVEERYIAPGAEHSPTSSDQRIKTFWKIYTTFFSEGFKMMIAIAGGLFTVVPMLIIILDPHRTKVSILIVISVSIFILINVLGFIGLVTEIIRIWVPSSPSWAMHIKDMLAIVTAYAAVLMVFVGGYVSGGTDGGTGS